MAAILATGSSVEKSGSQGVLDHWGAAVSHRSAAELWELLPMRAGPVEVSVASTGGRSKRAGIRLHRSRTISKADVTLRKRIPVTTPSRTIEDLRRAVVGGATRVAAERELRRAMRQASVLGLPVDEETRRERTRSDLERDFLRICHLYRLPLPGVNMRVGPYLVDFLWRDRRLAVETDGFASHRGRQAFEDDRARDLDLCRRGWSVIRLSEKQVDEEPERIAETLAAALRVGADGRRENERR
jgi:very-short-patch-repair endonuclease